MRKHLTPRRVALTILAINLAAFAYGLRTTAPQARFELVRILDGLNQPTYLTHAGDERLFIVERTGTVRIVQDGVVLAEPFLDISGLVESDQDAEQGLLSIAFAPNYHQSGRFYVDYTGEGGATVVARYRVAAGNPNRAEVASAELLLTVAQPGPKHNGGQLNFGPDGYLYISLGDGGTDESRVEAQNRHTLLGSILRLDVSGQGYIVPHDNPFVGEDNIMPEIWVYGLRNPWRFSFDRRTGDLFIADVGAEDVEEINFQPAGDHGGHNYGWPLFEGSRPTDETSESDETGFIFPAHEYEHNTGDGIVIRNWRCAIIGGYVYRGQNLLALDGKYLYGDWCSGTIWTLERRGGRWFNEEFMSTEFIINSFGEDVHGELYVLTGQGEVWKLQETS